MTIYSGFSHWKWWFSIVMLVYQRVTSVLCLQSAFPFFRRHIALLPSGFCCEFPPETNLGDRARHFHRYSHIFQHVGPHYMKASHIVIGERLNPPHLKKPNESLSTLSTETSRNLSGIAWGWECVLDGDAVDVDILQPVMAMKITIWLCLTWPWKISIFNR